MAASSIARAYARRLLEIINAIFVRMDRTQFNVYQLVNCWV